MSYTYEWPRPKVTVDCVIFGYKAEDDQLAVLLIERREGAFVGDWALPGGFVQPEETLDEAAERELAEETGVSDVFLEQLYTFGALERDPRARTITVAYYALLPSLAHHPVADTDAAEARWFSIQDLPDLAFDHDAILEMALGRLKAKVRYAPIGFELLPESFTLSELQHLYETILGTKLDKRNFRRKVLKTGLVRETGEVQQDVPHRAAKYYRFDETRYRKLEEDGYNFEL